MSNYHDFKFGTLATGTYKALLWIGLLIPWAFPGYFFHYVGAMLFLGLGLKPILVRTGLHLHFSSILHAAENKRLENFHQERLREIEQKERNKQLKSKRIKDPELPPNW